MPQIQNIAWLGNGGEETHALQFQRKTSCNFRIFFKARSGTTIQIKAQRIFTSFRVLDGIIYSYIITCLKALSSGNINYINYLKVSLPRISDLSCSTQELDRTS